MSRQNADGTWEDPYEMKAWEYKKTNLHLSQDACAIGSHWWREARVVADRQRYGHERLVKMRDTQHYRAFTYYIKEELEMRLSDRGLAVYFEQWLREKGFLPMRYKRIYIKINVDGKVVRHQFCAPAGKWYDESDIKRNRGSVMQWLKDQSPNRIFSEVQIGPNQFNYIAIGTKLQQE